MSWETTPLHRLTILAGRLCGPSTKGSAPRRHLAILAVEGGGPTTKGWAMHLVHGGGWYGERRRQLSGRVT